MTEQALDTNSPDEATAKPEQKETLGSFLWFVAKLVIAVLIFRSFIFSPFTIPSESMLPNLRNGDYLVAAEMALRLFENCRCRARFRCGRAAF